MSEAKTLKSKLINFIKLSKTRIFFENKNKTHAVELKKNESYKANLKDFKELVISPGRPRRQMDLSLLPVLVGEVSVPGLKPFPIP